jgi:hypothetical protein
VLPGHYLKGHKHKKKKKKKKKKPLWLIVVVNLYTHTLLIY